MPWLYKNKPSILEVKKILVEGIILTPVMNQYVLFDLCNTIAWGGVSHTRANLIELQMMDTYNPRRLIFCKENDPS